MFFCASLRDAWKTNQTTCAKMPNKFRQAHKATEAPFDFRALMPG